jgi:hypothetical protein
VDTNYDGQIDFTEFVESMTKLNPTIRSSAVMYARNNLSGDGHINGFRSFGYVWNPSLTTDDMFQLTKLFDYFDSDRSGQLSYSEYMDKMARLIGPFQWTDSDGNGQMSFQEFVNCMKNIDLAARQIALHYARYHLQSEQTRVITTLYLW